MFDLETGALIVLLLCLACVCAFEFINGFHDTANAVATVIYTNSLPPSVAVIFSGILNFFGVLLGGITVAMSIATLLPLEAVMHPNSMVSIALILSILFSAIAWNLGTWYYGIPASSSHTLIGAIIGATIAFSLYHHNNLSLVNWHKVIEIGLSLLISPLIGFFLAMILLVSMRYLIPSKKLFEPPKTTEAPPAWIRAILILTCGSVSFGHGSNDGQKGVGLLMVILIALVPMQYALNGDLDLPTLRKAHAQMQASLDKVPTNNLAVGSLENLNGAKNELGQIKLLIDKPINMEAIPKKQKIALRKHISHTTKQFEKFDKQNPKILRLEDQKTLRNSHAQLAAYTAYAPNWTILLISISLGLGTMIGWKRIVVTIGEKIGKDHLTYAQGASSGAIAAIMIVVSTRFGLPVSTTHVLSSGIAGSMVASKGIGNLQGGTVRNIALAWVLTLPVCITCAMLIFGLMSLFF